MGLAWPGSMDISAFISPGVRPRDSHTSCMRSWLASLKNRSVRYCHASCAADDPEGLVATLTAYQNFIGTSQLFT